MRRKHHKRRRRLRPHNPYNIKINKNRLLKVSGLILLVAIIITLYYSLHNVDSLLMPTVLAMHEMNIKNDINAAINASVEKVMAETDLKASDFYTAVISADGQVSSISVNTVLVNSICGNVATNISEHLGSIKADEIKVPAGALLGIDAFANIGPSVAITVKPVGNVTVDYDSAFTSVGINQVNFQIWLVIDTAVKIVNPPQQSEITLSRKVAIVNTVFSGQVPENYIGGGYVYPITDK